MTEFGLIAHIQQLFADLPDQGFEGIGDDCAILPLGGGQALVFTTDMLAEGVHFLRAATSARELGRKSLAVNLSDVAAMGATPVATLLSVAIPRDLPAAWIDDFMVGYHELSQEHAVTLAGGDTTASQSGIIINVTAIGRIEESQIKRRADARVGDTILSSGFLGDSAAGLHDILSGNYNTPLAAIHRNPAPQVAEGIWLGARHEVHAMMDISDGVASDIRHIMERSGLGAQIDLECVPTKVDIHTALCGGEDYKLLFTADAAQTSSLQAAFKAQFGQELYPIGRITAQPELVWLDQGTPQLHDWQGFRHY